MAHGLSHGASTVDANPPLPTHDQLYNALADWVEKNVAPARIRHLDCGQLDESRGEIASDLPVPAESDVHRRRSQRRSELYVLVTPMTRLLGTPVEPDSRASESDRHAR